MSEKQFIIRSANRAGLSLSDYIRKASLHQTITSKLTSEELAVYKLLVEYRNNFARISNLVKEKKDFTQALEEVIGLLKEQFKKLKS